MWLDGQRWRTVPLECAVRARLAPGVRLDRERARDLNRALRGERAVGAALRALRAADHSRSSLDVRLERHGIAAGEREAALAAVERAGLVDDERLSLGRAETLARRGWGDAAIAADLERRGIADELVRAALAALEPEGRRAEAIVAARGGGPRTARLLASRGFAEETVEAVVAVLGDEGLG